MIAAPAITPPAVTEGTLLTAEGAALPLKDTRITGSLDGPVASIQLTQRFVNDRPHAIEAVYRFPLPPEASVYEMRFLIADRVVEAVVKEKAAARAHYEAARSSGRAATLLEEARADLFTLSVANVPAGAEVKVELAYQQRLAFDDGEWRFVFPMVAPERYVERPDARATRGSRRGHQGYVGARLPSLEEVRPPRLPSGTRAADVTIELDVRAPSGALEGLGSPSHRVALEGLEGSGQRVRLSGDAAIANRDFVLSYRAGGAGVRPLLRFERDGEGEGTLLLALTPSSESAPSEAKVEGAMKAIRCANCGATVTDLSAVEQIPGIGPVLPCTYCHALLAPSTERTLTRAARPRDVTILVDRSASMRGTTNAARAAVRALLEALPPTDAIAVLACDHDRVDFEDSLEGRVALAPEVIERVDAFLEAHPPRGGSELERALEAAASMRPREGRTAVTVLITDGNVGNEGRILRRAEELLGGVSRLFVLGLGAAPDRALCARLARACGGTSEVLEGATDRATAERFARKVREGGPVLTGLSVAFEGGGVSAVLPRPVPDLFGGEPVFLMARYRTPEPTRLTITGVTADGHAFRQRVLVELPEVAKTPGLGRLWARAQVERLCRAVDGADPKKASAARAEATALALEHSIVSRFTSLVAADSEVVSEGPPERVEQPLAQASGAARGGMDAPRSAPHGEAPLHLHDAAPSCGHVDDRFGSPTPRGAARAMRPRSVPMTSPSPMPPGPMAPGGMGAPSPMAPPPMCAPAPAAPSRRGLLGGMRELASRVFGAEADDAEESFEAETSVAEAAFFDGGSGAPTERPPAEERPVPRLRSAVDSAREASRRASPIRVAGGQDYDADELRWLAERASGELDLVFLVDETGSMGPYIEQVKTRLLSLIEALRALPLCRSLRLGLVTYRDHPPQDHSYASRAVELTDALGQIEAQVMAMRASGGGDGPESVTDGLFDVVRMAWRPAAAKAVVWFGDAPPHGVEPSGDGFADGCPCGNHWYTQAESCREMGVAIYSIGCLPGLRGYVGAEDVFRTVASASRGRYLPLTQAHALVPLMATAAASELDRRRVDEHVAEALEAYAPALVGTDRAERVRWLTERLTTAGLEPREMRFVEGAVTARLEARPIEARDVEGALERLELTGRARA